MSLKRENNSLKRRIEELENEVKRLREKNENYEIEIKRMKGEVFRMDILVANPDPGLQNIAMCIFRNLDRKSLGNCRAVSKKCKELIDNDLPNLGTDRHSHYVFCHIPMSVKHPVSLATTCWRLGSERCFL